MASAVPISEESIDRAVTRATSHVFQVMAGLAVTLEASGAEATGISNEAGLKWMGSVGFVGDFNGVIYLCFPEGLAQKLAERILGMTAAELVEAGTDTLKDVVGEITNSAVGTFKNAFCDAGYPCKLTLPTIICCERPSIPTLKGCERRNYVYQCSGYVFHVDLQFTRE